MFSSGELIWFQVHVHPSQRLLFSLHIHSRCKFLGSVQLSPFLTHGYLVPFYAYTYGSYKIHRVRLGISEA